MVQDVASEQMNIDRRDALKILSLGGVTALAGCAGDPADDTDGSNGDELTIGVSSAFDVMNPIMTTNSPEYPMSEAMYSQLTRYDHNLEVVPDAATDWESNEDATEWVFTLRDDVTYHHNGEQLVAEDVKATLDTVYDEDVGSLGNGTLGPIESTEVIDETTVQINLDAPSGNLPLRIAKSWASIVPKDVIENQFDELDSNDYGSGPFILDEFTPGDSASFVANDDYFEDDQPRVDRVTFRHIPEGSTLTNSLLQEDIDFVNRVPPEQFGRVEDGDGIVADQFPGGRAFFLELDVETEPFGDNRFREAIKYAVDKEALIEGSVNGLGEPGYHHLISDAWANYADLDHEYGLNAEPEAAEEALADAGYPDGIEFDFPLHTLGDYAPFVDNATVIIQDQLSEVGIEFDIQPTDATRYWDEVWRQVPFAVATHGMRPTEEFFLEGVLYSEGDWNGSNWSDDEYDETLEAAMAAGDPDERGELLKECQAIAQQRGAVIVPFFRQRLSGYNNTLQNVNPTPTGDSINTHEIEFDN